MDPLKTGPLDPLGRDWSLDAAAPLQHPTRPLSSARNLARGKNDLLTSDLFSCSLCVKIKLPGTSEGAEKVKALQSFPFRFDSYQNFPFIWLFFERKFWCKGSIM